MTERLIFQGRLGATQESTSLCLTIKGVEKFIIYKFTTAAIKNTVNWFLNQDVWWSVLPSHSYYTSKCLTKCSITVSF